METDKSTMRGAAGTAFGETGRTIKEQAMQGAQSAKDQMRQLANAGREEMAGQLDCVARALSGAGDQLGGEEKAYASQYTRLAGEKVGEVAQYLREHDAVDLVHDVEDFARTNPLVFLGGCAIAGFLIGRFFKASPPEEPALELGSTMPYEPSSAYAQAGYGTTGYSTYDTRISSMPRTPAMEHADPYTDHGSSVGDHADQSPVVATPTIPTSDPWRPGNGSGQGG